LLSSRFSRLSYWLFASSLGLLPLCPCQTQRWAHCFFTLSIIPRPPPASSTPRRLFKRSSASSPCQDEPPTSFKRVVPLVLLNFLVTSYSFPPVEKATVTSGLEPSATDSIAECASP